MSDVKSFESLRNGVWRTPHSSQALPKSVITL